MLADGTRRSHLLLSGLLILLMISGAASPLHAGDKAAVLVDEPLPKDEQPKIEAALERYRARRV